MLQAARVVADSRAVGSGAFPDAGSRLTGRHNLARSAIEPNVPGFGIRAAHTVADRQRARELVERMYDWRGYRTEAGEPHSESAMTLVAADADNVVATIAVRIDGPRGLATDGLYRPELDAVRALGARLAEFTQLAVDGSLRSKDLLARLFHAAMIYARGVHRCSDVVIEVNPRHVRFYEHMFEFMLLGPQRHDPRVNAPAVPMRLDLAHAERQVAHSRTLEGRHALRRTLYPLFFPAAEEAVVAARLAQFAPAMHSAELQEA